MLVLVTDLTPTPDDPSAAPKSPAHRARVIAAAVSAGAFVGIGIGLVATNLGDDADPSPVSADGGLNQQQSPFGSTNQGDGTTDLDGDGRVGDPGDFSGSDQFGGNDQFVPPSDQFGDSDDFGGSDQFAPPSDQFGGSDSGATPAPFGGQTAPDTNSGGS
jgi:hypothetical protein